MVSSYNLSLTFLSSAVDTAPSAFFNSTFFSSSFAVASFSWFCISLTYVSCLEIWIQSLEVLSLLPAFVQRFCFFLFNSSFAFVILCGPSSTVDEILFDKKLLHQPLLGAQFSLLFLLAISLHLLLKDQFLPSCPITHHKVKMSVTAQNLCSWICK